MPTIRELSRLERLGTQEAAKLLHELLWLQKDETACFPDSLPALRCEVLRQQIARKKRDLVHLRLQREAVRAFPVPRPATRTFLSASA